MYLSKSTRNGNESVDEQSLAEAHSVGESVDEVNKLSVQVPHVLKSEIKESQNPIFPELSDVV